MIAAQQLLANHDQFINKLLTCLFPPLGFLIAFLPKHTPIADFLDGQSVLMPFATSEVGLEIPRNDHTIRKSDPKTHRGPVCDIEWVS